MAIDHLSRRTAATDLRRQTELLLHRDDPFHERSQLLIHVLEVHDDVIQHVVFVIRASQSFQTLKAPKALTTLLPDHPALSDHPAWARRPSMPCRPP